jgi:hypothetical protein
VRPADIANLDMQGLPMTSCFFGLPP